MKKISGNKVRDFCTNAGFFRRGKKQQEKHPCRIVLALFGP